MHRGHLQCDVCIFLVSLVVGLLLLRLLRLTCTLTVLYFFFFYLCVCMSGDACQGGIKRKEKENTDQAALFNPLLKKKNTLPNTFKKKKKKEKHSATAVKRG